MSGAETALSFRVLRISGHNSKKDWVLRDPFFLLIFSTYYDSRRNLTYWIDLILLKLSKFTKIYKQKSCFCRREPSMALTL